MARRARAASSDFINLAAAESFLGPALLSAIREGADRVAAEELPDELELVPRARLRFRHGREVTRRTRELEALGFEPFADHRAFAVKVARLRSLLHRQAHVFAAIHDDEGAPLGISAVLEDGTRLQVTTTPKRSDWPEPLHHETHWVSGLSTHEVVARFFEVKGSRVAKALDERDYVAECRRAWVERVDFIKSRARAPSILTSRPPMHQAAQRSSADMPSPRSPRPKGQISTEERTMDMSAERWAFTSKYLAEVFGREPAAFARIRENASVAGLPAISISADVGRLLTLLVNTTRGLRGLEIGTLGGYSAAWIARGMRPGGKLVSLELDAARAEIARKSLSEAGVENVEVRVGDARQALEQLDVAPGTLDVVFIDADKESYERYFDLVKDWIAPGGLLMADNVIGAGAWWIDMTEDPTRRAVDRFNRLVVADERFEVVALPIREGVLVARRKDER